MDVDLLGFSDSLAYIRHELARARREAESRKRTGPRKPVPTDPRVLVAEDGLQFRVLLAGRPEMVGKKDRISDSIAAKFQTTFGAVWDRIPRNEKQELLDHWTVRRGRILLPEHVRHSKLPLIEIQGSYDPTEGSDRTCRTFGHVLCFPAGLVTDSPASLSLEIARALAIALRHARGQHMREFWEIVEEPYEKWLNRAGKRAESEDECEAIWAPLRAAFDCHNDKQANIIVSRWALHEQSNESQIGPLPMPKVEPIFARSPQHEDAGTNGTALVFKSMRPNALSPLSGWCLGGDSLWVGVCVGEVRRGRGDC